MNIVMQTIMVFDQITISKEELENTNIIPCMEDLCADTPNRYLKYRLELVLDKWHSILAEKTIKHRQTDQPSNTVFDAIVNNDDEFFETKNVPELLHRMLKSFNRDYKVK